MKTVILFSFPFTRRRIPLEFYPKGVDSERLHIKANRGWQLFCLWKALTADCRPLAPPSQYLYWVRTRTREVIYVEKSHTLHTDVRYYTTRTIVFQRLQKSLFRWNHSQVDEKMNATLLLAILSVSLLSQQYRITLLEDFVVIPFKATRRGKFRSTFSKRVRLLTYY